MAKIGPRCRQGHHHRGEIRSQQADGKDQPAQPQHRGQRDAGEAGCEKRHSPAIVQVDIVADEIAEIGADGVNAEGARAFVLVELFWGYPWRRRLGRRGANSGATVSPMGAPRPTEVNSVRLAGGFSA